MMVVGQPAISGAYFSDPVFSDYFTSLDIPDPTNIHNTGKWSDQHWVHNFSLRGQWHENYVANGETQRYVTTLDPTPDGWSPFTLTPDGLVIRAEEIPTGPDHLEWSLQKRYYELPNGDISTTGDYPGWPNVSIPGTTIPAVSGRDYILETNPNDVNGPKRVLWLRIPQRWRSGILTGRNGRASLTQGRQWFVAKMPKGAENDGSGNIWPASRSCGFCAGWDYEQTLIRRGLNNQPLSTSTGTYPFNDYGTLNETDVFEHGTLSETRLYHALHWHKGHQYTMNVNYFEGAADNAAKSATWTPDPTDVFYVFLLDVTFEQTGIAVAPLGQYPNYVRVVQTPRWQREVRRKMLLDTTQRSLVRNADSELIAVGEQLNDDGSPRLGEMHPLINLAMDGKWLRNLASSQSVDTYATLPDGRKYTELSIKSFGIQRHIDAQYVRFSGEVYQPYTAMAESTVNPWDNTAVTAKAPTDPVT